MIVYRSQSRIEATGELLSDLCTRFRAIEKAANPNHDEVRRLLIDFGVFESGLADALMDDVMMLSNETRAVRKAATALGRLFYRTCRGMDARESVARFGRELADLTDLLLPGTIRVSVPEGYAYYGLYPESYIVSAEKLQRERSLRRAVVVGIRSIGASLSAVVAGALEELGCRVKAYTVRPAGHPFDRHLRTADTLDAEWHRERTSDFVIVDEGPGMSGSSFTCVAEKLVRSGVPDGNIAFFPSWDAAPDQLGNESAAQRWRKHRRYVSGFDQPWLNQYREVSAGEWRSVVYGADHKLYPAVQPQHEARKYLAQPGVLLKFAGVGTYGSGKLDLARTLAERGFTPEAMGFTQGFLALEFVPGKPLRSADVSSELLSRIAEYCAFRGRTFHARRSASFETLFEMIETNTREGLGRDVRRQSVKRAASLFESRPAVAVDGRMMLHEWLQTPRGWLKADAVDHHADHFYPGVADIAWDLAAASIELRLKDADESYFLSQYARFSGDVVPRELMRFYRLAYSAFRLGYCTLAARATAGTPDRERFEALRNFHAGELQREAFHPASAPKILVSA
jgi:hypothetical protein